MKTNYLIKHVDYKLTDTGLENIEPKEYFINKSNKMLYSLEDGPFSAKGFLILDANVYDDNGDIHVEYIIASTVKDEQWEKFKYNIVDPVMACFWKETMEIANDVNSKELSAEDIKRNIEDNNDIIAKIKELEKEIKGSVQ